MGDLIFTRDIEHAGYEIRDETAQLRAEIERLRTHGSCLLAGPGRGDCEHFIGLPGESIPGQHDGPDDTVDVYGKPNGWCWACWRSRQIEGLRAETRRSRINSDVEHGDFAALLRALGLFDGAQPRSRHELLRNEILPAIKRLRTELDPPECRLQIGPDGYVPTNARDGMAAWKREAERLEAKAALLDNLASAANATLGEVLSEAESLDAVADELATALRTTMDPHASNGPAMAALEKFEALKTEGGQ